MQDRIGAYRVEGEVGRGGMGVVYRAVDERLDRAVAIKALPEQLASDPDRLERFEREAKTLASLSHPNLAGIYGVEEQEGAKYLVLEYVDGETLADRLDRGPLPVDDAIELAAQIASGVEAAHDAGVIHRDLKPANIKITPEGAVKVLDFGLARSDEGRSTTGASEAPTISGAQHSPTMPGAILGTAAYMSPEQARGRKVDRRADVWSFGVVLYEMLVGASPFVGETASDSIGAVLHKEVDLSKLPPQTPANVRRVLARCLERDKSRRYRDIGDIRIELLRKESEGAPIAVAAKSRTGLLAALVVGLVALAAVVGWLTSGWTKSEPEKLVRKYTITESTGLGSYTPPAPAISPDGTKVAYVEGDFIHVRDLASFESRVIAESEGGMYPFWSPDSRSIGFRDGGVLYRVALGSGGKSRICSAPHEINGLHSIWADDGRVIFNCETEGLYAVSARGGEAKPFLLPEPGVDFDFHGIAQIPGSDVFIVARHPLEGEQSLIAYDGERRTTLMTALDGANIGTVCYSETGHILYQRGYGTPEIWAVAFDADRLEITGEPFLIASMAESPMVSRTGVLSYFRTKLGGSGGVAWFGTDGKAEALGSSEDMIYAPVPSPDGRSIAYASGEPPDIRAWVLDLERGGKTPISFNETGIVVPMQWMPDGSEVLCLEMDITSMRDGRTVFLAPDGSGPTRESFDRLLMDVAEDGRTCVGMYEKAALGENAMLAAIDLLGEREATQIVEWEGAGGPASGVALRPQGDLLAFSSTRSGGPQVYLTRFPSGQGRWPVSIDGGRDAKWSSDGSTLYFANGEELFKVGVESEPSIIVSNPEPVFSSRPEGATFMFGWSVEPGGERILAPYRPPNDEGEDLTQAIAVVENWYEEFRETERR